MLRHVNSRRWVSAILLVGRSLTVASSCAAPSSADGASIHGRWSGVRAVILQQMEERQLPAVAIAVAHRGRIVFEEGFGWADRDRKKRARGDTVFPIASITKPLTATGLMQLVEAERIDLDAPINDYLGSARLAVEVGDSSSVTVRSVANHTAGIPQHWQFFPAGSSPPSNSETLRRYGAVVRRPGARYEYSNIDYAALAQVIEQTSGLQYADYMRQHVFVPLGMTDTAIEPAASIHRPVAVGYDADGRALRPFVTDYAGGAGGMSSAHDLIRFAMFQLKDRSVRPILSRGSLSEMQRATAPVRSGRSYGIGWHLDMERKTVEHGGYFPGTSAILRLVPEADAAVVVLTNISNDDQGTAQSLIADATLRVVVPGWQDASKRSPSDRPDRSEPVPAALAGRWSGPIKTYGGLVPVSFDLAPGQRSTTALTGDDRRVAITDIRFDPSRQTLEGDLHATVGTDDARRALPYVIHLDLDSGAGSLTRAATLMSSNGPTGPRVSYWISLRRSNLGQAGDAQ